MSLPTNLRSSVFRVCVTICGQFSQDCQQFETEWARLFAGGLASPLRMATGGAARWRLKARPRRSPAPRESDGARGPGVAETVVTTKPNRANCSELPKNRACERIRRFAQPTDYAEVAVFQPP